jgi:hypothetical protein
VATEAELPALPLEGATPREIREALHPEYRDDFDRDYRAALDEAGTSLDLAGVLETVESWRRRCWFTRDRDSYRQSMRRAAELLTGEVPPENEPVAVTEARVHSHS